MKPSPGSSHFPQFQSVVVGMPWEYCATCQVYGRREHSSIQPYSAQKNSEYNTPLMFIVPRLGNCLVKNHLCKKNICGVKFLRFV